MTGAEQSGPVVATSADGLAERLLGSALGPVDLLSIYLGDRGSVIVMDEAVADTFSAPGDEVERLMYGFSLLACLPDGMADPPTAATGTVMRPDTLRRYAQAAGFDRFDVLPISDFGFWRFYRLADSTRVAADQ
jgi:hypothetical protein